MELTVAPPPAYDKIVHKRFIWQKKDEAAAKRWWDRYSHAYAQLPSYQRNSKAINDMALRNMREYAAFVAFYDRQRAAIKRAGKAQRKPNRYKAEGNFGLPNSAIKRVLEQYDSVAGILQLLAEETGANQVVEAFLDSNPRYRALSQVPVKGLLRSILTETSVLEKALTAAGVLRAGKQFWQSDVDSFYRDMYSAEMTSLAKVLAYHARARYDESKPFEEGQWNRKTFDMALRTLQNKIGGAMKTVKMDRRSKSRREDANSAHLLLQRCPYIKTFDYAHTKMQPIAAVVHGEPGVGKTFLTTALIELYAHQMCGLKSCPDNFKYTWNNDSDFDDTFDPGARAMIIDDVGQSVDAQKRAVELNSILRVTNNQNMDVLRAEVTEKGLFNYGNIEFVGVTSNRPNAGCSSKSFAEPNAIFRRLNTFGFVNMYFDEDVPQDRPRAERWRFDVYERWTSGVVYRKYPIRGSPGQERECLKLTFSEFLEYATHAFVWHREEQERILFPPKCKHDKNPHICYFCAFESAGPEFQQRLPPELQTLTESHDEGETEDADTQPPPDNTDEGSDGPSFLGRMLERRMQGVSISDDAERLKERIWAFIDRFTRSGDEDAGGGNSSGGIGPAEGDKLKEFLAEGMYDDELGETELKIRIAQLNGAMDYIESQNLDLQLKFGLAAVMTLLVGNEASYRWRAMKAAKARTKHKLPTSAEIWVTLGGIYGATMFLLDPRYGEVLLTVILGTYEYLRVDVDWEKQYRDFVSGNKLLSHYFVWAWDLTRRGCSVFTEQDPANIAVVKQSFFADCGAWLTAAKKWRPSNLHMLALVATVSYLGIRIRNRPVGFVAEGDFEHDDDEEERLEYVRKIWQYALDKDPTNQRGISQFLDSQGYSWVLPAVKEAAIVRVPQYAASARYLCSFTWYHTVGRAGRVINYAKVLFFVGFALLFALLAYLTSSYLCVGLASFGVACATYKLVTSRSPPPPQMPDHFVRNSIEVIAAICSVTLLRRLYKGLRRPGVVRAAEGVIASTLSTGGLWTKSFTCAAKNRNVRPGDMDSHMARCVRQVMVTTEGGSVSTTHMTILDGEICFLAGHIVAGALKRGDKFTIEVDGCVYPVCRSKIVLNRAKDHAFVWLPFAEKAPSMVKYLPDTLSQFAGHGRRYGCDGKTSVTDIKVNKFDYRDADGELYSMTGYSYKGYSTDGYCGMPVISTTIGANYFVGFHVAGDVQASADGTCLLTRVTRGDYDAARAQLVETVAPTVSTEQRPLSDVFPDLMEPTKTTADWAPEQPQVGSAVCAGVRSTFTAGRKFLSTVTETPFVAEMLTALGLTQNPFSKPMCGANKAYQRHITQREQQCTISTDELIRARQDYESVIYNDSELRRWIQDNVRVLDSVEAVNGVNEGPLSILDGINMKTSPGFGLSGTNKLHYMDDVLVDDRVVRLMNAELSAKVQEAERRLRAGETCGFVFRSALKNEALPTEKADKKIRVFSVGQLEALILSRKYMGAINAFIQSHPFTFECALGANAHGVFWDTMARRLLQKMEGRTDRVLAGDYSSFDLCISNEVMQQACLFYVHVGRLAGYDEGDINVIRGLFADIVRPTVLMRNEVWQFSGTNPSGHPLTTFVNSIANSLYYRSAFYSLNPHLVGRPFRKYVSLMTFGDDSIAGVAPGVDFPHSKIQAYFAERNVKYTLATKQEGTVEYQDIGEVDFLKRRFVYRPKGWMGLAGDIWAGPLDIKSITKSLLVYIPSNQVTVSDQFTDIFRSVATESALHGPSVYDSMVAKMCQVAKKKLEYGIPEVQTPASSWLKAITDIRNPGYRPEA